MIGFDWSEWAILRFVGASCILWLCYYLLFDRKAPFNKCRIYLLCSVLVAGVVATVRIPVYPVEVSLEQVTHATPIIPLSYPTTTTIEETGIQPTLPTTTADEREKYVPPLQVKPTLPEEPFYMSWNYESLAWYVYGLGALILLTYLTVEILRIWRLKRWGSRTIVDADGIEIVRNNNVISPFSFYRTIFINRKIEDEVLHVVLLHEKAHISNHHYRDTFLIECLCILCWFNPFVWLIKRELRALHEFQVDRYLLTDKIELFNYQRILFEELMGYSPNIANGFHNSLIKKRFIMMKHQNKEHSVWLRKSALLVVLIGITTLFSFTEKPVYTNPKTSSVREEKQVATVPQTPTNILKQATPTTKEAIKSSRIDVLIQAEKLIVPQAVPSFILKNKLPKKHTKTTQDKSVQSTTNEADLRPDQLVISRASHSRTPMIRFVECAKNETRVTIAIPIAYDKHWVQFEKGMSIVGEDTKDIYRIRSVTRDIELNKVYWIPGIKGHMAEFTLVFPPLGKEVKEISIRDCFPEEKGMTPPNGGTWELDNINISQLTPTRARLEEYDREGRPRRADKFDEVTLRPDQIVISPHPDRGDQIVKIVTTDKNTLVILSTPIFYDSHWLSIGKGFCLVDCKTGDEYPIQGMTNGIELNKLLWVKGCKNRSILLTLVFPKLNKKVKNVDFYCKYPDANAITPSNGGGDWIWKKLRLKDYQEERRNIYL